MKQSMKLTEAEILEVLQAIELRTIPLLPDNWLQVLDTAESSQVDQCVGHQLHAIMPLLDTFETE